MLRVAALIGQSAARIASSELVSYLEGEREGKESQVFPTRVARVDGVFFSFEEGKFALRLDLLPKNLLSAIKPRGKFAQKLRGGDPNVASVHLQYVILLVNLSSGSSCFEVIFRPVRANAARWRRRLRTLTGGGFEWREKGGARASLRQFKMF